MPASIIEEHLSEKDLEIFRKIADISLVDLDKRIEWQGRIMSPGFSAKAAKYFYENWSPNKGDVLVSGYPKTGTTWLMDVIRRLLNQDEKMEALSNQLPFSFRFIETESLEKVKIMEKLPLKRKNIQTHLPSELVRHDKLTNAGGKIVCIFRNPKDHLVSFYNFIPKVPPGQNEPLKSMVTLGWDKYFKHAMAGDLPLFLRPGEWYVDHVKSWAPLLQQPNVYSIYYEDMKKDLKKEVKKLAEFLEVSLTEEKAQEITEACSFESMKNNVSDGRNFMNIFMKTNLYKGEVGGWKNYFTVSQSEHVDAIVEEKLKGTNIKFTYEL